MGEAISREANSPPHDAPSEIAQTGPEGGACRCREGSSRSFPALSVFLLVVLVASGAVGSPAGAAVGEQTRQPSIQDISYASDADSARIVIHLDRRVSYKIGQLGSDPRAGKPPRIYVDMQDTLCPSSLAGPYELVEGPVERVRAARFDPKTSRLVLDLREVGDYKVSGLSDPDRIVVEVWRLKDHKPGSATPKEAAREGGETPSGAVLRRPVVVLDPGHGGHDPGAVGPRGLEEKTVALDVAKRVRRILSRKDPSLIVHLTRESDRFLSLTARTDFANAHGADLFVSIHCNAAPNASATGLETYYLDNTTDKAAIRLAAFENRTAPKKMSDLQMILRDLEQSAKVMESHALAQRVQRSLLDGLRGFQPAPRDLGVKGNLFYVLMGARMPSILVEVSFITNPQEEGLLKREGYREEAARGIAEGILGFLQETEPPGLVARQ